MNGGLALGIQLRAQNQAGPAVTQLTGQLAGLQSAATQAGRAMDAFQDANGRWRNANGRFLSHGEKQAMGLPTGGGGSGSGGSSALRNLDLRGARDDVAALGSKLQNLGTGGLKALDPAYDAAKEFSFAIAQVRTVIDEASYGTDDLRKVTMGLADTYGGDAATQANALYEVISAGVTDAKQATDLLGVANRFAIGGTTELQGAVDVLTSAVNTYADKGLDAKKASDLMFTAIAAGKTTARELSHSLGEVAPTAHAAGVGFDELQAAIAALTVQGIKTPQAVTALNAMLSNIQKPSSDAATEARRLGIEFNATALKSKGLTGVLAQLKGNTKVNDETFVKLFGSIDGVKGALALTANGGEKFAEILGQMKDSAGATDKAFNTMNDTGVQGESRLKAIWKNAMILVGQGLEPMARAVVSVGHSALEWFNRIPQPVRDFATKVFAGAAAATALLGVLLSGAAVMGGFVLAIQSIGVTTLAVFAPVVAIVAAAFGAIVLAVMAVKTAIDRNIGGAGDKFRAFVDGVKMVWRGLSDLFTTGGISSDSELFQPQNAALLNLVTNVYSAAMRVGHFFSSIKEGFQVGLVLMGPTLDRLGTSVARLGEALGITTSSADGARSSWAAAGAAGRWVGQAIASAFELGAAAVSAVMDVISGFASKWDTIKAAVEPASSSLTSVWNIIKKIGQDIGLLSPGQSASGWVTFGKMIGTAVADVASVVAGIVKVFSGVFVAITGVVDLIGGIFTGDWAAAWQGAKKVVLGLLSAVLTVANGILDHIAGMIDGLASLLPEAIRPASARAALKDFIKTVDVAQEEATVSKTSEERARSAKEAQDRAQREVDAATGGSSNSDLLALAMRDFGANMALATSKGAVAGAAPITNHVVVQLDGEIIKEHIQKGDGRDTNPRPR